MVFFGGGIDAEGAGSVTAGVADTVGATSAAGRRGADCLRFFALLLA